ncbi:hypothetical protein NMY22_g12932 [Coprinellus aureogranulatus]|nr:hypothetical protein NMY22_g12932 [Coprinellus aureogranulatus]
MPASFIPGSLVQFRGHWYTDPADNHYKRSEAIGPFTLIKMMNAELACLETDRDTRDSVYRVEDLIPYVPPFHKLPAPVPWNPEAVPIREITNQRVQSTMGLTEFRVTFEGFDDSESEWVLLPRIATQPGVLLVWYRQIGWINAPRPVLDLMGMLPQPEEVAIPIPIAGVADEAYATTSDRDDYEDLNENNNTKVSAFVDLTTDTDD